MPTRSEIGAEIGKTDKQTAMGRIRFDPKAHLSVQSKDGVPIQFYQIRDGECFLFYPDQYATGAFEQPNWMKLKRPGPLPAAPAIADLVLVTDLPR